MGKAGDSVKASTRARRASQIAVSVVGEAILRYSLPVADLSNEEAERFLHELMRQIASARGSDIEGQEAIRIAMAGVYATLINLERSTRRAPLPPQQPD